MIDLRSDTVTKPCPKMRELMAAAEVGDDVFGEDPTVNLLQERAAALLGKEAALFVPSGTMGNLLAFLAHTRPGDTVIMSADAHPYNYESGNLAMVGGLLTRLISGQLGKFTAAELQAHIVQSEDHHFSNTTLAAIENTTNRGGGACYSLEEVEAIGALAHERGMRLHCDGARLFNAVIATGVSAADYARHCDTVSFCLSKGLGAPVGSLLVGNAETINRAHRFRKMVGGGMRQAGILAAAGLHALEEHIDDLAKDHRRATQFRQALEGCGVVFPLPSPTNILYLEMEDAPAAVQRIQAAGVKILALSPTRIRVVFHRDISDDGLDQAVEAFRAAL